MISQHGIAAPASLARASGMQSLRNLIGVLVTAALALRRRVTAASHRRRVERELQSLPDLLLKDIGVARSEIPWIAVTQAGRIRAHGGVKQRQLGARDRRPTRTRTFGPFPMATQQGKE